MGENQGKGTQDRNVDELSGMDTSSAGMTATTGKLNNGARDGGNRQSADAGDGDTTPAPGTGTRSRSGGSRQSGNQQGSNQGSGLGKSLDQDVMGKEN